MVQCKYNAGMESEGLISVCFQGDEYNRISIKTYALILRDLLMIYYQGFNHAP